MGWDRELTDDNEDIVRCKRCDRKLYEREFNWTLDVCRFCEDEIMTVRKLIEELQNCENKDAVVYAYVDGTPMEIVLVDDGFENHERVDLNIKEEN